MPKRIRLNLEFPPDIHQQMLNVQARTGAASITEVIRRALALYDYATAVQKRDGRVMVAEKGTKPESLRIL